MAYEGRRVATGTRTAQLTSLLGGLYDYEVAFDNPLNTTDYVVVASVFSPTLNFLSNITIAGVKVKEKTKCTITVKSSGILALGSIQIDVIATRRVTS